jgi:hypothetical protein
MGNDEKLKKYYDSFLTEAEKVKLENLCNDEVAFNALKKVLLQGIYTQGTIQKGYEVDPLVNGAFSLVQFSTQNPIPDEEIGKHLKSMWAGVNYLKNSLDSLENIKSVKDDKVESPFNEAI